MAEEVASMRKGVIGKRMRLDFPYGKVTGTLRRHGQGHSTEEMSPPLSVLRGHDAPFTFEGRKGPA
jgi:hypothetical protein